jgi:large subunit ribosomal protein L1
MYNNTLEALNQIKNDCKTNFDSTIELHINLNLDVKKADQMIRFTTVLPNGTGKTVKVAVLASTEIKEADLNLKEEDLDLIISGKLRVGNDFDLLVAEPAFMSKIAKVARVLGPAGVMPNPKNGTVTSDVKKAVEQLKKGKIEIRTEQNFPIIHTVIGKSSFEAKQLEENLADITTSLKQNRPSKAKPDWIKSIFLSSTMGGSYQLDPKAVNL